jgi:effector-binding domain-containing protein
LHPTRRPFGPRLKEISMSARIWFAALALSLTPVLALAQSSAPPPPPAVQRAPAQASDPFGVEMTLPEKNVVFMKGTGNWDSAFETLTDAFKTVYGYLEKQGVKPFGPAMTVYTATDDTGFQYQAAVPIEEPLKNPPRGDIAAGKSPSGKAYHFVHRGSYDAMDTTYEAITNFLDEKKLEAKDMFIEEYVTDLRTTPEDKLVVNVFVPTK